MSINLSSSGLRGRTVAPEEDNDPMSTLANLTDVMLVFACGLMLALVVHYNVDIGTTAQEVTTEQELEEVNNLNDLSDQLGTGGQAYTELGTVYQDPVTGKMYMLREDTGEGTSTSSTASSTTTSAETSGNQ